MGQTLTEYFTREQQVFLDSFRTYPAVLSQFYLTGGTALAACYFNHRLSEDIDLFSPNVFNQTQIIETMQHISKQLKASLEYVRIDNSLQYTLKFSKAKQLKIDFVAYLFHQIHDPVEIRGLKIDSMEDIATNKLLTINQRTASKDYVDLYFILKGFTFWDLRIGVEHKFGMEMEPFYIASLLQKAETLTTLPRMKKKLSLETLKKFFFAEAKKLAMTMVKP